jgi:hypothetical protein
MNRVECVKFGLSWEKELMPLCAKVLNEEFVKTSYEYDTMDFQGKDCWAELKVRGPSYYPCQFQSWLLPYCKIQRAMTEEKQVFYFYYWTSTKQLFVIEYNKELFDTFRVDCPEWKQDKQIQIWVPSQHWEEITIE